MSHYYICDNAWTYHGQTTADCFNVSRIFGTRRCNKSRLRFTTRVPGHRQTGGTFTRITLSHNDNCVHNREDATTASTHVRRVHTSVDGDRSRPFRVLVFGPHKLIYHYNNFFLLLLLLLLLLLNARRVHRRQYGRYNNCTRR